jgi:hypothetical protein
MLTIGYLLKNEVFKSRFSFVFTKNLEQGKLSSTAQAYEKFLDKWDKVVCENINVAIL